MSYISKIKKACQMAVDYQIGCALKPEDCQVILDMIKQLEWIPVSKQLPDDNIAVDLVVVGDEIPDTSGEELIRAYMEGGKWFDNDGDQLPAYYIPLMWRDIPMLPEDRNG